MKPRTTEALLAIGANLAFAIGGLALGAFAENLLERKDQPKGPSVCKGPHGCDLCEAYFSPSPATIAKLDRAIAYFYKSDPSEMLGRVVRDPKAATDEYDSVKADLLSVRSAFAGGDHNGEA